MENIFQTYRGIFEIEDGDDPEKFSNLSRDAAALGDAIAKETSIGDTCLDVGFNYGWASYNFLKSVGKAGRVFAWEPGQFLFENYASKFPFPNFKAYQKAVSDSKGIKDFHVVGEDGADSGLNSLEKLNKNITKVIPVECIRLDDWWEENGKIGVDIVKIDCENHDWNVLMGAKDLISNCSPKIIIEENTDRVKEFMKGFQYKSRRISDQDTLWTNTQEDENG
jgi:FkbM family methyltransferase